MNYLSTDQRLQIWLVLKRISQPLQLKEQQARASVLILQSQTPTTSLFILERKQQMGQCLVCSSKS